MDIARRICELDGADEGILGLMVNLKYIHYLKRGKRTTNYQKFTSECMYSGNLDKARAEENPWLPALEEVVNRLPTSTLERIMEGAKVWILGGIPVTLGMDRHTYYIILLPEGDWSFEARVGIIAHEFAHTMDGLESCTYEWEADDVATHWGFGKEVELSYERQAKGSGRGQAIY